MVAQLMDACRGAGQIGLLMVMGMQRMMMMMMMASGQWATCTVFKAIDGRLLLHCYGSGVVGHLG